MALFCFVGCPEMLAIAPNLCRMPAIVVGYLYNNGEAFRQLQSLKTASACRQQHRQQEKKQII